MNIRAGIRDEILEYLVDHKYVVHPELLSLFSEEDSFCIVDSGNGKILEMYRKDRSDGYEFVADEVGKHCYSVICGRGELCSNCISLRCGNNKKAYWIEKSDIDNNDYFIRGTGVAGEGRSYAGLIQNRVRSYADAWKLMSDDADGKDFLISSLSTLSETEISDHQRHYRRLLDLGCEFYGADSLYLILYGSKNEVYISSRIKDEDRIPEGNEFSMKTRVYIQDKMQQNSICYLDNMEEVKETHPELYEVLSGWGSRNMILVPLFRSELFFGFILLNNVSRHKSQLSVLFSLSEVVYGIRLQYEEKEKRRLEEENTRKRKEKLVRQVLSNSYALLLHINLVKGTYEAFLSDDPMVNSLLPIKGDLSFAIEKLVSLVHSDYRAEVREFANLDTLDLRIKTQPVIFADYRTITRRWARSSVLPVSHDEKGKLTQIIFGMQIIDEEKRRSLEQDAKLAYALEEVREANEAKTSFFRHMSHDIRTPMNAIFGMTRIAQEHIDEREKVEDCLSKIMASSNHLLSLINDSLDLSRIESGKVKITHEPMHVRDATESYLTLLQGYIVDRNLDLSLDIDPLPVPFVMTDELHLRQVIINVLSNAIKYTPDGGSVNLHVMNEPGHDERHIKLIYVIKDTGIGMSEEFINNIYEPFSQADSNNARTNYQGTGLGMSIVHRYVELMGGKIGIESKLNVGTTVTISFEFEKAVGERTPETVSADTSCEMHGKLSGKTILLVEDNDINREIALDILSNMNLSVVEAVDGLRAVEVFSESEPFEIDCILMDIMMPRMDGYAATREIRKLDRPDADRVPIIAMTANAFAEDVRRSHENGMNDHLSKPIDPVALMTTLKKYV